MVAASKMIQLTLDGKKLRGSSWKKVAGNKARPARAARNHLVQKKLTFWVGSRTHPDPESYCRSCKQPKKSCFRKLLRKAIQRRYMHWLKYWFFNRSKAKLKRTPPTMPQMRHHIRRYLRYLLHVNGQAHVTGELPSCVEKIIAMIDWNGHEEVNYSPDWNFEDFQDWKFSKLQSDIFNDR